ncbi:rod-binding protein [Sphingosinicella terrae]|uniref:rod-binding protein n=1 Tax=Sphingosinicella terrae TaxID=2172047 RepID=UPI000E0D1BF1|nr:rod-binding protein [Sphingosinicella terrae]
MNEIRPSSGPVLPPVAPAAAAAAGANAADTARDFEAVFLGQMARLMLESVEIGDQFSGGHGEEMFRGILAENLGTEMARRGGVGLAPTVMDHIIRLQGGNPDAQ